MFKNTKLRWITLKTGQKIQVPKNHRNMHKNRYFGSSHDAFGRYIPKNQRIVHDDPQQNSLVDGIPYEFSKQRKIDDENAIRSRDFPEFIKEKQLAENDLTYVRDLQRYINILKPSIVPLEISEQPRSGKIKEYIKDLETFISELKSGN